MMKKKDILFPLCIFINIIIILFGISTSLEPVTERNLAKKQQELMEQLLPDSKVFTQEAYEGEDTNISALFKGETGYVIEVTVEGYVDRMTLWVGVDNGGNVTGVMVRDMAETLGLGSRAMTDMSFLSQFLGGTGDAVIGENIDALSGATVSSKAVAKAINSAVGFVTGVDVPAGATEWGG